MFITYVKQNNDIIKLMNLVYAKIVSYTENQQKISQIIGVISF